MAHFAKRVILQTIVLIEVALKLIFYIFNYGTVKWMIFIFLST